MGATVMAAPALYAIYPHITGGEWQNAPNDILYSYTGFSIADHNWDDPTQLAVGVAAVGGGFFLAKLGKFAGRMLH